MQKPKAPPTVRDLLAIAQRRWGLILVGVVAALAAATAQVMRSPKLYRATATLAIERPTPADLGIPSLIQEIQDSGRFAATQRDILVSRTMIKELVRTLELDRWDSFEGAHGEILIERVRDALEVEPRGESALVDVSFVGPDRERAAQLVNALCDLYLDHVATKGKKDVSRNLSALEAELPRLRRDRDEARGALETYKSENSSLAFEGRKELLMEELGQQSRILQSSREEYDRLMAQKLVLEEQLEGEVDLAVLAATLKVPSLVEYSRKRLDLQSKRADASSREGTRQAELDSLDEQLRQLDEQLAREQRQAIDSLFLRCDVARRTLEQTEARRTELETMASAMDQVETKRGGLQAKLDDANRLYDRLLHRRDELLILQSGAGMDRIWVQDRAAPPLRPCAPRTALILALASGLGLLLGFLAAFVREKWEDRLTTDVEGTLEVPPIAWIPLVAANSGRPPEYDWVEGTENFPVDAFRKLLFSIDVMGADSGKVITVLSAIPREGKSLVSTGIALCAARAGYKTLLVDGDLKHPRLDEVFALQNDRGVVDVLASEANLPDVIQNTATSNLDLLAAGVPTPALERLTHPKAIRAFLDSLRETYQVVVVDTSPILFSSDSLVFCRHADESLIVASTSSSRVKATQQALAQLRNAGLEVRGTVLNRFLTPTDRYGRYGYAYLNQLQDTEKPAPSAGQKSLSLEHKRSG